MIKYSMQQIATCNHRPVIDNMMLLDWEMLSDIRICQLWHRVSSSFMPGLYSRVPVLYWKDATAKCLGPSLPIQYVL
jgi:hypothetical protein